MSFSSRNKCDVQRCEDVSQLDGLLAKQGNKTVCVPVDSVGGSGGGYLPLTTTDRGQSYQCDLTFAEMKAAIGEGVCYGVMDNNGFIYPVVNKTGDYIVFARIEISASDNTFIKVHRLLWNSTATSLTSSNFVIKNAS